MSIQPSHPLSSPSPTFNLSQHQGLFKWVSSSHQVAKVLEFQLQHQSWIFIGRTGAEAEAPILWPPDAKNWLIGKDPDAGKDWRWEKGMTEDNRQRWLDSTTVSVDMCLSELQEFVMDSKAWSAAVRGVSKSCTRLRDWTELNGNICGQVFVWLEVFIFLGRFLGVKFLGHTVSLCLTFKETAKMFSKITVLFYILTSNIRGF